MRYIETKLARLPRGTLLGLAAAAFIVGSVYLPKTTLAKEYSTDVRVNGEEELRQLYYDGLLDEEEFYLLLRLLESPVDLNRSEREDLYQLPGVSASLAEIIVEERVKNGPYIILADLQQRVPDVTWRLVAQIDPFLVVSMPKGTSPAFRGKVKYGLYREFDGCKPIEDDYPGRSHPVCSLGYDKAPAMALSAKGEVMGWLDFGMAATLQEGVKYAEYDPASRDIYAAWGNPLLRPHSAYIRVRRQGGSVVVGSYQLDFGRGLVMSTSSGGQRHGFNPSIITSASTDRIRQFDGLFGGAARAHSIRAGRATLDITGFGSVRTYDWYQYYLGLAGGVQHDPVTAASELDGPRIWIDGQKAAYITLPNVFRVALGGGNITLRVNRRTHVGVSGYGAYLDRKAMPGVTDDHTFLLERIWPNSTGFGTVGVDGAFGFGLLDFSGELAVFLHDGDPGLALYFRAEVEPAWGHFALSLRRYDENYANPYAGAEANSDQFGGNRARNEEGIRFKATLKPLREFRAGVMVDVARNIKYDAWDARVRLSVQGRPLDWLQLSAAGSVTNQNLVLNGRDQVYGGEFDPELAGSYSTPEDLIEDLNIRVDRAGEKYSLSTSVRFEGKKVGHATVRYSRSWTDNNKTVAFSEQSCQLAMQQAQSIRFTGRVKPTKTTTIAGSAVYSDGDTQGGRSNGGTYGGHSVYGYLQVEQKVAKKVKFRLRGAVGRRLPNPPSACDERDATDRPAAEVIYEPTDYALRHFGSLIFTTEVKF
jgi:hypothetical protein